MMERVRLVDTQSIIDRQKLHKIWSKVGYPAEKYDELYVVEKNQRWLAIGGRSDKVIKGFYVEPDYREQGLVGLLMGALLSSSSQTSLEYLYLFTSPEKASLFTHYGFHEIARANQAVLLYRGQPISERLTKLYPRVETTGHVSIVMNCNPMTKGHEYLVNQARLYGKELFIFIVEENQSLIPFEHRIELVRNRFGREKHIHILPSTDLIVSNTTFPSYFIKDKSSVVKQHASIDVSLFRNYFCPHFGIAHRVVGEEPTDWTTNQYNQALSNILPPKVRLTIIPRFQIKSKVISASMVRHYWAKQDFKMIEQMVSPHVLEYLKTNPYPKRQEIK